MVTLVKLPGSIYNTQLAELGVDNTEYVDIYINPDSIHSIRPTLNDGETCIEYGPDYEVVVYLDIEALKAILEPYIKFD